MKIDAHQHFWAIARGDYGWLTPELTALYRDFQPVDLEPELAAQDIAGTVLVQAAPTVAETLYMLGLAAETDYIKGVVGWVDFESAEAGVQIAELATDPQLVGLRPMIQDIEDDDWMLRPDLAPAFEALIAADLTFDALTFPRHLANLSELLARYPNMRVVVDHGSKPDIADNVIEPWKNGMARIASETSAFVKLSGLVTEASADWRVEDLKPYVDHLLETFGPDRMVWGSDWPVCTLAASYGDWCATTDDLLAGLTAAQRDAVMGGTAQRAYHLAKSHDKDH